MNLWTIIPVKSLRQTKSRLGALLSPDERAALTIHLLERTLGLLPTVPLIRETAVITRDPQVAKVATRYGYRCLPEPPGSGLNGAVTAGVTLATQNGASHCLVLPSDLPFLAKDELSQLVNLVQFGKHHPTLILCGDRQVQGTNGLIVPTGHGFCFRYGRNSFHHHQNEAAKRQLLCRVTHLPSIQFDLDTVEDYALYTKNRQPITS